MYTTHSRRSRYHYEHYTGHQSDQYDDCSDTPAYNSNMGSDFQDDVSNSQASNSYTAGSETGFGRPRDRYGRGSMVPDRRAFASSGSHDDGLGAGWRGDDDSSIEILPRRGSVGVSAYSEDESQYSKNTGPSDDNGYCSNEIGREESSYSYSAGGVTSGSETSTRTGETIPGNAYLRSRRRQGFTGFGDPHSPDPSEYGRDHRYDTSELEESESLPGRNMGGSEYSSGQGTAGPDDYLPPWRGMQDRESQGYRGYGISPTGINEELWRSSVEVRVYRRFQAHDDLDTDFPEEESHFHRYTTVYHRVEGSRRRRY